MTTQTEKLPYGIGRFTPGWVFLIVLLLAFVALGIFAYSRQLIEGLVVTGLRDIGLMGGSPWGLYITFDIYFVGVSFAGITVAVLIRLLNLKHLKPISRMAELLTIISLILAGLVILPDLGQPLRGLVNLLRYARPGSPFFGTFTLVISGYLFGSVVYFFLDGRRDAAVMAKKPGRLQWFYRLWAAGYRDTSAERERHQKASFWLAIAILPLLVTAHSTLGFVFGLQVGRPGWFSALQAPGFVILAGVSGVGHIIIIAAILRRVLRLENQLGLDIFKWLGNLLMTLTIIYLYFMVVEWLTTTYASQYHEVVVSNALLVGEYSGIFWSAVALLVISFLLLASQLVRGGFNLSLVVLSGVFVNIAAVFKRYLIVVPSQTHGTLMPYLPGSYSPTWVEYSIISGLLALGALLFILFIKVFPIMEVHDTMDGGE